MIIVAGSLRVEPAERATYLEGCAAVVRQARQAAGCLDFALSADLVEDGRINVFERWESEAELTAFRGSGPALTRQQRDQGRRRTTAQHPFLPGRLACSRRSLDLRPGAAVVGRVPRRPR